MFTQNPSIIAWTPRETISNALNLLQVVIKKDPCTEAADGQTEPEIARRRMPRLIFLSHQEQRKDKASSSEKSYKGDSLQPFL